MEVKREHGLVHFWKYKRQNLIVPFEDPAINICVAINVRMTAISSLLHVGQLRLNGQDLLADHRPAMQTRPKNNKHVPGDLICTFLEPNNMVSLTQ